MRVFVTGSTGLLGQNLVQQLVSEGNEVVALTRSREKFERFLGVRALPGLRAVEGDMLDVASFRRELSGCDAVFHTAAYFREYYQRGEHEQQLTAVNIDGTLELIAAADEQRVKAFVHVSSSGTIGSKSDGSPGDESTAPAPAQLRNLYFRSKYDGEQRIARTVPAHGMRVIEILPGWMWGPGDAGPTSAGQLALDFLAGKLPAVPEGGGMVVDARDVASAMLRARDCAHGERFLLAGRYMSLREVIEAVAAASGRATPALTLPTWLGLLYARGSELWAGLLGRDRATVSLEGMRVMADARKLSSAKAERLLGARFRPFAETARDTLSWYAEHGFVASSSASAATRAQPSAVSAPR